MHDFDSISTHSGIGSRLYSEATGARMSSVIFLVVKKVGQDVILPGFFSGTPIVSKGVVSSGGIGLTTMSKSNLSTSVTMDISVEPYVSSYSRVFHSPDEGPFCGSDRSSRTGHSACAFIPLNLVE